MALGEIQHYAKNTKKFCRFFEFLKRGTMSEFLYRWIPGRLLFDTNSGKSVAQLDTGDTLARGPSVPKPGAGKAHCGPAPRPSAMPRMHCAMAVLLAALIVAWAGVLLEVCEVKPRALCRKAAAAASAWPV